MKYTVAVDFDGVIHKYDRDKWDGIARCVGAPVFGVRNALLEISKHYTIAVHTCRAVHPDGIRAVERFMRKHDLPFDYVTETKPQAIMYIDDRGHKFENWTKALTALREVR